MLKIENLSKSESASWGVLLNDMFNECGIKLLNPEKKMLYWRIQSEDINIFNYSVFSVDAKKNEFRAVYFVTRKKGDKKLQLFKITTLFPALHETEKNVTIAEAIEKFLREKDDYIVPVMVMFQGKIAQEGMLYAGTFLYNVSGDETIRSEMNATQYEKV